MHGQSSGSFTSLCCIGSATGEAMHRVNSGSFYFLVLNRFHYRLGNT